jgi:hypothetical protein
MGLQLVRIKLFQSQAPNSPMLPLSTSTTYPGEIWDRALEDSPTHACLHWADPSSAKREDLLDPH